MPGMDGLELLARLKSDPALARIPVLVLTASAEDARVEELMARGATAYVIKPFPPRELVARISDMLAGVDAV